jgi:hypothetical protein
VAARTAALRSDAVARDGEAAPPSGTPLELLSSTDAGSPRRRTLAPLVCARERSSSTAQLFVGYPVKTVALDVTT